MSIVASIISTFDPKGFTEAQKGVATTQQKFDKFAKKAALAFAGVSAAVTKFAMSAADDAADAAKLATILQNVTGATDSVTEATANYVDQLSLATGVADSDLRASLIRLITSTKDLTKAQQLQNLALEISAGTGKDLGTVTNALAKAYDGNFGALGKLGVSLSETTKKNKDFDAAVSELSATFSGSLQTQLDSTAGKTQIMKNAYDEATESIGYVFLPLVAEVGKALAAIVPFITENSDLIGKLTLAFLVLTGAIVAINLATKAWTAAVAAWTTVTKVAAAVQAAWNAALAANPIGLIVLAIAALVAAIVVAYKNFEPFRNLVDNIWQGMVNGFTVAKDVVVGVFTAILNAAKSVFNKIADLWNGTLGKVSFSIPDWVPSIGGNSFGFPKIPKLAKGGIVTKPTLALIGEAGAEAVVPLNGRNRMGNTYNVNINSALADPEGVARAVKRVIQDSERRAGAYGLAS